MNDFTKYKISEFDKELKSLLKPLTDYIQAECKKFKERIRYAVVRNGITQQVTTTRCSAERLSWKDDELWLAYVNEDNSVELLVRIEDD